MSTQRERISDARGVAVAVLVVIARVGLAVPFACLLAISAFHTSLQLSRLIIGILASSVLLLIAGSINRDYRVVSAIVLYSSRVAALLFLALVCLAWARHVQPRSILIESAAIVACTVVVALAFLPRLKRRRRRRA